MILTSCPVSEPKRLVRFPTRAWVDFINETWVIEVYFVRSNANNGPFASSGGLLFPGDIGSSHICMITPSTVGSQFWAGILKMTRLRFLQTLHKSNVLDVGLLVTLQGVLPMYLLPLYP